MKKFSTQLDGDVKVVVAQGEDATTDALTSLEHHEGKRRLGSTQFARSRETGDSCANNGDIYVSARHVQTCAVEM